MNMITGIGLNVAAWIYPPLQGPLRVYQAAGTIKTVCSVVTGVFTGGISPLMDGVYALATSSQAKCAAARQLCLMNAGNNYWQQTVCEQVYQRCISALG